MARLSISSRFRDYRHQGSRSHLGLTPILIIDMSQSQSLIGCLEVPFKFLGRSPYWKGPPHIRALLLCVRQRERERQAGAELCQAQVKLWLAKLAVTKKKLRAYKFEVRFHLKRYLYGLSFALILRSSSICQNSWVNFNLLIIEVVFHFPKN